mmetsp:Transcript_2868/g.7600  ORF Transcript_2868/g.7600 Transcript_2868/m.7600 type:complete len:256 (+) Transcript_2868:629-1396(+)
MGGGARQAAGDAGGARRAPGRPRRSGAVLFRHGDQRDGIRVHALQAADDAGVFRVPAAAGGRGGGREDQGEVPRAAQGHQGLCDVPGGQHGRARGASGAHEDDPDGQGQEGHDTGHGGRERDRRAPDRAAHDQHQPGARGRAGGRGAVHGEGAHGVPQVLGPVNACPPSSTTAGRLPWQHQRSVCEITSPARTMPPCPSRRERPRIRGASTTHIGHRSPPLPSLPRQMAAPQDAEGPHRLPGVGDCPWRDCSTPI